MVTKVREERHEVALKVRMQSDGPMVEVCIRNISSRGMMLEAPCPPRTGQYVELFGTVTAVGRVVWSNANRFGISTRDRVNLSLLLGIEDSMPSRCTGRSLKPAIPPPPRKRVCADQSRMIGRAADFILVSIAASALAALAGYAVYGLLSQPFEALAEMI